MSQFRHNFDVNKYIGDPESFLVYPIFDRYFNATIQSIQYHQEHFVGMLATNFYWYVHTLTYDRCCSLLCFPLFSLLAPPHFYWTSTQLTIMQLQTHA